MLPSDSYYGGASVSCCRRWLEYEEAHGTAADVEGVKQRAMEYMRAQETA